MKRRRYSAQRRPLYSTYFTTTRKNDMSCKNINSDFTLFIHSCVFPRAARNKKAIVSISSTKQQRDDDSSRTICTKNLFWSLSLSKSCKDLEGIVIHMRVEIRRPSFPFMGFVPTQKWFIKLCMMNWTVIASS